MSHPLPLNEYVEHSHKNHPDKGRVERYAESLQIYRGDPLYLMRQSAEYFMLMDELMQSYGDGTAVNEALRSMPPVEQELDDNEQFRLKRLLDEARQNQLLYRLHQAA